MKSPLLVLALLIAMGSWAMGHPSGEVRARAKRLEKRVEKDLAAAVITKEDADKYDKQLEHIYTAMDSQGSTTAERRGMREDMDRIEKTLDVKEGKGGASGGLTASPTP